MTAQPVRFRSTDGLALEGEIDTVPEAIGTTVICHAHPKMQGTMQSPLLLAIRDDLVARKLNVVRFNFRGVGGSEGEGSTGILEVADAAGAVAYARESFGRPPVALVGWSFGAGVAARAAAEDGSISGCALIAPPVKDKPGITAGLPAPRELGLAMPVLVVCGSNDHLVSLDDCRAWVEGTPNVRLEEIKAANHFFWAKYEDLVAVVGPFVEEAMMGAEEGR